jgi:hypothetical protein
LFFNVFSGHIEAIPPWRISWEHSRQDTPRRRSTGHEPDSCRDSHVEAVEHNRKRSQGGHKLDTWCMRCYPAERRPHRSFGSLAPHRTGHFHDAG